MILSEDISVVKSYPETPIYHNDEGIYFPDGSFLTFNFDDESPGIPREAQRIVSVSCNYGHDYLAQNGGETNIGRYWIDTVRSLLYTLYQKHIRLSFILGPDGGAWSPGFGLTGASGVVNFVTKKALTATGSNSTTITITEDFRGISVGGVFVPYNYETGDAAVWYQSKHSINPGYDYVYSEPNGKDLTLITSCNLNNTGGSIDTATPLSPSDYYNNVTIIKPTSFPSFPYLREDRTIWTERNETGWIAKSSFNTAYIFSEKVIAYPLKYSDDTKGTFKVMGSLNNLGTGGLTDLSDLVLGDTPETMGVYEYSIFPSTTSPLQFTNTPTATLNLSSVAVPDEINYIKVYYAEQIIDENSPTPDSMSATQTSCSFCISIPTNSALANFTGTGDILDVYDPPYFCSKYKSLNTTEISAFRSLCNNSSCRFFKAWNSYVPSSQDVNKFFSAKGVYFEQMQTGRPNIQIGRNDYDGILTFLGFPTYDATGLFIPRRTYNHHGKFEYNTNQVDPSNGYIIFRNWQESIDAAETPHDNFGLFGNFSTYMSKKDSAGGLI